MNSKEYFFNFIEYENEFNILISSLMTCVKIVI